MRIVVVQTAFLGDLILSVPLLKQVKAHFDAKVSLVCRKGFGSFVQQVGLVDDVFEVEKSNQASYKSVQKALNQQGIDHVICPHQSFRSGIFVQGLKVRGTKVGFSSWWTPLFFHKTIKKPMALPDALRQLSLLTLMSEAFRNTWEAYDFRPLENSLVRDQNVKFTESSLPEFASMKLSVFGDSNRQESPPLALVAPGSVWETKKWTEEGFHQLALALEKKGYQVVLIGSPAEFDVCERVKGGKTSIENRAGEDSLFESLKLMSRASLLISNDSGAMHLASLVELPTVTIFGPTVLDFGYRPWNQNSIAVQKPLDCRPCGKHGHKVCPIGTHACMKNISAEDVVQAVTQITTSTI